MPDETVRDDQRSAPRADATPVADADRAPDATAITEHLIGTFAGVHVIATWGERAFFYDPERQLPRGVYLATLKERDGKNDRASNLQRPGVFRLNFGVGDATYAQLFGPRPARPAAGEVVDTGHDFSLLDRLLPHPIYAWMGWICVLNPSAATFAALQPLLTEAHRLAMGKLSDRVVAQVRRSRVDGAP